VYWRYIIYYTIVIAQRVGLCQKEILKAVNNRLSGEVNSNPHTDITCGYLGGKNYRIVTKVFHTWFAGEVVITMSN